MSIAVIIATFGDAVWLETRKRAIRSVEHQGFKEWSIRHDGDTVSHSRNLAAAGASADWLCFLDADDELAPGYVGAMRRALEQVADGDRVLLAPAVQTSRNRPPFFYPEKDLREANWLPIGTLIQRELFWEVGGFDERDPHGLEDWSLWTRAAKAGARVVKVPDAVYVAHQGRGASRSHSRFFRSDRDGYMREYRRIRDEVWA